MKLFDPRAALAEIEKRPPTPATPATTATQTPKCTPCVAKVAGVATPQDEIRKFANERAEASEAPDRSDMRYGYACNGSPKTWTGKVVSLTAWRQLTEWDKHGPDGRLWNGITKTWEKQE